MEREEIKRRVYSKIDEIPTLSAVLTKLLNLIENKRCGSRDIADAISHDPVLTSKVLKVANSAYYGFQGRITSLTEAVTLLGFNMIRSIALSMNLIKTLSSGKSFKTFSEKDIWIHSLTVATAMQELSKQYNRDYSRQEYVFIIGLLHDIGKIIFDQFFTELFEAAIRESFEKGYELYVAERNIIGIDHGEVGGMLLKRWNFPDVIVSPIAYHHSEKVPKRIDPVMISLLKLADSVALSFYKGDTSELSDKCAKELEYLEMEETVIQELIEYLEDSRDRIMDFFNAIK
jgi:putative nucleotidyltransferase with HDIG domain